jgi:hypothetical protein
MRTKKNSMRIYENCQRIGQVPWILNSGFWVLYPLALTTLSDISGSAEWLNIGSGQNIVLLPNIQEWLKIEFF